MPTFDNIGLAEPSTVTDRVASVTFSRGSTTEHQEILCIGDPDTSNAISAVLSSSPGSTAIGLVTRSIIYPPDSSNAATSYLPVRLTNGTAYVGNSVDYVHDSSVTPSTIGGPAQMWHASSVASSVGGASDVVWGWANQYGSPQVGLRDSTGGDAMNSSNRSARVTVMGFESERTYNSTIVTVTSTASTAFYQLVAGSASTNHNVFAYSITSTVVTPGLFEFISDTTSPKWGLLVGSASSGVVGANLATSPPAFLFQTTGGGDLNVRAATTGVYQVSISYWSS